MQSMRTTITLEEDVSKMVDDEVHRTRTSFRQVVNGALRRALSGAAVGASAAPYRVRPHTAALLPGLDRRRLNALADEIEDGAVLAVGTPSRP
jgi:hypothetical protein